MQDLDQAHAEADRIRRGIALLLRKAPITRESAPVWCTFLRTVGSTLNVLEAQVDGFGEAGLSASVEADLDAAAAERTVGSPTALPLTSTNVVESAS